jgi:hypothetical protein
MITTNITSFATFLWLHLFCDELEQLELLVWDDDDDDLS